MKEKEINKDQRGENAMGKKKQNRKTEGKKI